MKFGLMFERDATNSRNTKNSRDARNIRNSHNNINASNSPGANNSSNPRKSNDADNNRSPPITWMQAPAGTQATAGTQKSLHQQYSRVHSSIRDNSNRGGPATAGFPSSFSREIEIEEMPESFRGNHEKIVKIKNSSKETRNQIKIASF